SDLVGSRELPDSLLPIPDSLVFSPQLAHVAVRFARGLGNAKAVEALPDQLDRRGEGYAMSLRHVNGFDVLPAAQHNPHVFAAKHKRAARPRLRGRLRAIAHQERLRAPDRGLV